MQFALWIVCGVLVAWLMGKVMSSEGRDHVMDLVMGLGGGIGGGLLFGVTRFGTQGNMIYSALFAILGAVILTFGARFAFGRREYGRTE